MYNPAEELSSISFDKIIGGTLNAVVNAQNTSSMTTVEFIKNVGFKTDANGVPVEPIYVDFKYPKEVSPYRDEVPAYYTASVVDGGAGYSDGAASGENGEAFTVTVNKDGEVINAELTGGYSAESDGVIKLKSPEDGAAATIKVTYHKKQEARSAQFKDMVLQVPILTIMPVPFIRVDTTDIELNVKINSISTTEESSSTDTAADVSASANYKAFFVKGSVKMNASISHQKKSSSTEEVKKEYSLNVKIHAVQDDLPVGMSRILDILEESIIPRQARGSAPAPQKA